MTFGDVVRILRQDDAIGFCADASEKYCRVSYQMEHLSSVSRGPSGHVRLGDGPGIMGLGGALVVSVAAFIGLMMGVLGVVRGLRKNTPRDGTNVGLAGSIFDVGVIVLAVLALASLIWLAL